MGDASSPTIEIPVIDISGYLDPSRRSATQTQEIVRSLRSACQSPGFFQITGHNIPVALRQSLLEEIGQFFNLPPERKQALHRGKSHCLRGWESVGEQSLEAGFADQKEGFMVGLEMPGATRFLQGPNQWPEPEDGVSKFRGTFMQYFEQVRLLSRDVFRLMALSLELEETYFDSFDDSGGLEVFHKPSGTWHAVRPIQDAFVVNIGDMMERWTNEKYTSTLHRVITPVSNRYRYSVAFFNEGLLDQVIECIPSCLNFGEKAKFEPIRAEDHLKQRYGSSY
ncbi:hypothetical protein LTR84_008545 [Exophiala bonariae]|uniref:Fe2OG dioxygenase domain-containing protein n=1 Tax=Exophiala bonariae TaxID=1690606 RepID=A0AAV9MZL7_9EURO|nr:hypothetical protein LTR84_008545 [Exophiala bonariae]